MTGKQMAKKLLAGGGAIFFLFAGSARAVPENGEVKADFTLGIKNLPKI